MQKSGLIACLVLMLGGCANISTINQAVLADNLVFELLPPSTFGRSLLLTQAVTVWFEQESHDMLFYTEISETAVNIVGTLPGGTRLFTIIYDGRTIHSEGHKEVLANIKPEYFLADLQIAQWPLAEVVAGFIKTNDCFRNNHCVFQETPNHLQRSLVKDGEELISIKYEGIPHYQYTTEYEHRGRHYRLRVESLAVEYL